LYCFRGERRAVLLHAIEKKTQKTPKNELDTARRRMALLGKDR